MGNEFEALVASLYDTRDDRRVRADQPFLIAIDGKSGAGKSTFGRLLGKRLAAALVSVDDFYAGGTGIHRRSPEEMAGMCVDRVRLRSVLEELKSNRPARYSRFDWERFDGTQAARQTTVEPRPILIVEGVYANHPDVRDLMDFSVLLHVSEAERQRRLQEREGTVTEWERQWHRAEDWYFGNAGRPEMFDLLFSNE